MTENIEYVKTTRQPHFNRAKRLVTDPEFRGRKVPARAGRGSYRRVRPQDLRRLID